MSKLLEKYPQLQREFTRQELEVLDYASKNHEYMWAAKTMGIILDCEFRESLHVYRLLQALLTCQIIEIQDDKNDR